MRIEIAQHESPAVLDPRRGQQPVTFDAVKTAVPGLAQRVEPLQWQLLMPRLRFGRPWWVARPQLDIDYHVQHASAAAPGGDRELAATISVIVQNRLDRARPAWQLWYVDGLAGGRIALVWKIHHAVADGTAALRLLETICSADPDTPLPSPALTPLLNQRRPAPWAWLPLVLWHQLAALAGFPRVVARTVRVSRTMLCRRKAGKPSYAAAFSAPGVRFNAPLSADRRFAYRDCGMATIKRVARLSDEEIYSFVRLLFPAGVNTTLGTMGNMLWALLIHPEQLERVRRDPEEIRWAVEEALRWEPGPSMVPRIASTDVTWRGIEIPSGTWLLLAIAAANRDPEVYPDPDRFDISRHATAAVTFGSGPHVCLGMFLALAMLQTALRALLDRLPGLRIVGADQVRIAGRLGTELRGPNQLQVCFDA